MRWKRIPRKTEGTYPEFSTDIDLTSRRLRGVFLIHEKLNSPIGIENGTTGRFTGHRFVENWGKIFPDLQWGVEGRDGHNGSRGLDT